MAEEAKRLIRFNFKSYLADEDRLYDTNIVDAAKEAGIYDEKALYEPVAHILGTNRLFADLEAALASAEIGKECEVTIPCEKAAGARNPKNVEYYPLKDFVNKEKQQYPQPGMTVTVGNKSGTIASVGAGRVKVDFNSPLAGHDLTYKFTVVEEVTEPLEKAKAVVEADFSTAEGFEFAVSEDKVVVTEPDLCKYDSNWNIAKYKVVADLRQVLGITRVEFIQVWDIPKKE
ncbi:MAG: peptidylprolyl isomerase [Candidatus Methanomethylophilaceae archaeon]|nr:peptidylprolyl isomerase [Candidatus Methanomethylophilaceae archaeon]